jgi:uncharacterized protein YdiU (UPF0061 family)
LSTSIGGRIPCLVFVWTLLQPVAVDRSPYNVTVSRVLPTPFSAPADDLIVLAANTEVIEALGINPSELSSALFTEVFSGRKILPGASPFAHAYGGHQFGYWSGIRTWRWSVN